jgi:hypothetical protein
MLTGNGVALHITDRIPRVLFLMGTLVPFDSLGSKLVVDASIAAWVAIRLYVS